MKENIYNNYVPISATNHNTPNTSIRKCALAAVFDRYIWPRKLTKSRIIDDIVAKSFGVH